MRINTNVMALNTNRQLSKNNDAVASSTEKLSSGLRINRAGDDAAGLAISEKMRAQIAGLDMASKNSEDAISLVQTAEGALEETHSILQRMRELAVQAASDTNEDSVDRAALDAEFQELIEEINDIAANTAFNDMNLLDGSFGSSVSTSTTDTTAWTVAGVVSISGSGSAGDTYSISDGGSSGTLEVTYTDASTSEVTVVTLDTGSLDGAQTINVSELGLTIQTNTGYTNGTLDGETITMVGTGGQIQTGANEGETLTITIGEMTASALGVSTSTISSLEDAEAAITAVNDAINSVSTQRSLLGATQNRLEHKIANLDTSSENLTAAESRIRDLDMAEEMTEYTSANVLVQAATAMLAQANSAPQNVLSLLQ